MPTVYMTQTISTIVDNHLVFVLQTLVYMTQTISTIVDTLNRTLRSQASI